MNTQTMNLLVGLGLVFAAGGAIISLRKVRNEPRVPVCNGDREPGAKVNEYYSGGLLFCTGIFAALLLSLLPINVPGLKVPGEIRDLFITIAPITMAISTSVFFADKTKAEVKAACAAFTGFLLGLMPAIVYF
jgi:hypothetical protein